MVGNRNLIIWPFLAAAVTLWSCGPVPRPRDGYVRGDDIVTSMDTLRGKIHSFRISGVVDHYGEGPRIQGKVFLFALFPDNLRVDLLSPFGNPLSVLTVNDGNFAMSDLRQGVYMTGPAKPCNIARLVRIPLPADRLVKLLVGDVTVIPGERSLNWDSREGRYVLTVEGAEGITQQIEIDPDREVLPVRRVLLLDGGKVIYEVTYDRWRLVSGIHVPHEVHVKMPQERADLSLRYDDDGVEVNVELPPDAWVQSFPPAANVEFADCP